MTARLTLYDCSTAPSPRRARILLAEKGVRHDTVQVDLRSGEQLGEAFRRINPKCTVPVLQTEDENLRNARLRLVAAAKQTLANALHLLDIKAPEVM